MELPENLKYTSSHEWIADNRDGTATLSGTPQEAGFFTGVVTISNGDAAAQRYSITVSAATTAHT